MKKFINILLLILFIFTLISCEPDIDEGNNMDNILNIYTLNDFHGAIFENKASGEIGISKIGSFLKAEKEKALDNTIILSAGDMFQGSAVSSLTKGKAMVDLMNYIGFDAMALGNHEFDWGTDEIIKYVDGNTENGEANFPFLGANIFHIPSDDYVSWAKPYIIIERGNLKIGILGLIGEELTSSIIGSVSKNYEFTSSMAAIKKYVPIMRNEEGADIVIVASHDDTTSINYQIKNLENEYYVDAVLNGHTHKYYAYEENRGDYPPLTVIQSGSNGKYIGHISLELDLENKKVKDASVGFVGKEKLQNRSKAIEDIIDKYSEYVEIAEEYLGQAGKYINKTAGETWAADTIGLFDGVDLGIINAGGIRTEGFPIDNGDSISYGTIFKIMPFENQVITLELSGYYLRQLVSKPSDLRYGNNFDSLNYTINGIKIEDDNYYRIAVIDFVFYRYEYIFIQGKNIIHHDVLFRQLLIQAVKDSVIKNGKFSG